MPRLAADVAGWLTQWLGSHEIVFGLVRMAAYVADCLGDWLARYV